MSSTRTRSPNKKSNASRILQKSLQLFNKNGVQSVSNRDIASALDISSGNLTYHFKKKTQIIDALVGQMFDELMAVMAQVPQASANPAITQADSMFALLKIFWKFRFFFNSIRYLTQIDKKQIDRFLEVRNELIEHSIGAYETLIEQGVVKPIEAPNSVRLFVENTWYLWFSLIRLYQIFPQQERQSERGFYRFSTEHIYSLMEPHYTEEVRAEFYEYMKSKAV